MALPKKNRLPRRDFLFAKANGKSYSHRLFSAILLKKNFKDSQLNRYGVVVSKKIHHNAVIRNRLKRLIILGLPLSGQVVFDIIIYPKKAMLNLSHAEINTSLNQFLSEIYSQKP
jgi:ribonuclease P protein component